ncbi:glycosyltransferase family 2 protein [Aurantiacibacter hainanensis]|uniref:glycosyltransferase family 2 protein n=1 Tax=Aurantiacibacter hainanensis TaxID=3076114 RepID=UPI0030C6A3E4
MGSIPISVVIPVRDEEANLAACLKRLGEFAEVVVVDSGSTDRTCEIATEYGASVVQFAWNGRYPKKRNWTLLNQNLENDWVLFLDADEFITPSFCSEVRRAIQTERFDGYWLNYTNHFLGTPLRHGDPQRKLALFRVGKGLYEKIDEAAWSGLDMEVHEHPLIEGEVGEIAARIDHRDDRGVAKFIARHKDYALWEASRTLQLRDTGRDAWEKLTERQRKKYSNIDKWWFAWAYFAMSYVAKRGFLDGGAGFAYAAYKLWYFATIRLLIKERIAVVRGLSEPN